jgi:hypothetical protein
MRKSQNGVGSGGIVHERAGIGGQVPFLVQRVREPPALRLVLIIYKPRQAQIHLEISASNARLSQDVNGKACGVSVVSFPRPNAIIAFLPMLKQP